MTACIVPGCAQGAGPHDRHEHIVGDWMGEKTAARGRAVVTLAETRASLVALHADLARERAKWVEVDVPRAIACQTHASHVVRIIDNIDRSTT